MDDLERWAAVEATARRVAGCYGYQELRTPLLEEASLFLRSIGETTDLVQKEMFRFTDRGGHDIVLRPEGTAAVVRAYLQHHLHKTQGLARLFYLGPMFRAERPQAGRMRQFHQYGVETIGSHSPWVDAEVIALCLHILEACDLSGLRLWVASMGSREDQQRSARQLRERLAPEASGLCADCQTRFQKNAFRILDCKTPRCRQVVARVVKGSPYVLSKESQARFDHVRLGLDAAGIAYDDSRVFARGLDYYTQTVFEVRAEGLGAQDAVAAGGRYDELVQDLGGPPMGAVGFAAGIERILLAQETRRPARADGPARHGLYLAVTQPGLVGEAFRLTQHLRARGVAAIMEYDGKSLKAQLREADKLRCRLVAILGPQELERREVSLKDLAEGSQRVVSLDAFADDVARALSIPSS